MVRKWWTELMSLMDEFLPNYQFSERHQTTLRCAPALGSIRRVVEGDGVKIFEETVSVATP